MSRPYYVSVFISMVLYGCGSAAPNNRLLEEWDHSNDPVHFSLSLQYQFDALPMTGATDKQAWADTYWPSQRGGIANRWREPDSDPFTYASPDQAQLSSMSPDEIAMLSPAEKYDIYVGNYNYDFVNYERSRTSPDDEGWFGLCHGWAPAAINFEEPAPIVVTGANGIAIPFGSSDIKALLTFVQQFQRTPDAMQFLGGRCDEDIIENPDAANLPECRDINAGTFHVILANVLGIEKQGFVADITRDRQVWNQPIHSYESAVVETLDAIYPEAAPGTERILVVETKMNYTVESQPHWESTAALSPYPYNRVRHLTYTLELDAAGKILGGEWIDGERPDFLWRQTAPVFSGYFSPVAQLYEASLGR